MAFCSNCGAEVSAYESKCERCGTPTGTRRAVNDEGGFGWSLLGFCIPLVGLILYLVWSTEKPVTARAAGKGALFGFIFGIVLSILQFLVIGAAAL